MKFDYAIVFDLNGVCKRWHAKEHYETMMSEAEYKEFRDFLRPYDHLWNLGVSSKILLNVLLTHYPQREKPLRLWFENWTAFPKAVLHDTIKVVQKLDAKGYELYAITNHQKENFPEAIGEYEFLRLFRDIIISGYVGFAKPDKRIFHHLLEKHNLDAKRCIFVDDVKKNVTAAIECGYHGIHFKDANQLQDDLIAMGVDLS